MLHKVFAVIDYSLQYTTCLRCKLLYTKIQPLVKS